MAARVHPSPRPERKKRATRSCAHLTVVASGGEAIAPQRGANITPYGLLRSLRASLAASRPPPRAAPRRGKIPPAPLGRAGPPPAWPERPTRLPLPICRPGGKASEARRPKAGGLFGCLGEFFKKAPQGREAGRGLGGRAPPGSGGVVNRVEPVGGQWATRSVVHAVHRRPRLSTPERATGR